MGSALGWRRIFYPWLDVTSLLIYAAAVHCRGGNSSPTWQACVWTWARGRGLVNKRPRPTPEPYPHETAQQQGAYPPSAACGGQWGGEQESQVLASQRPGLGPWPVLGDGPGSAALRPQPLLWEWGWWHHPWACSDVTGHLRRGGSTPTPLLIHLPLPGLPQSPAPSVPHWRGLLCGSGPGQRPGGQVDTSRRKASLARPGGCHPARGPAGMGPLGTRGGGWVALIHGPICPGLPAGVWTQVPVEEGCTGAPLIEPTAPSPLRLGEVRVSAPG